MAPDWQRIERLFHRTLEEAPETRQSFLDRQKLDPTTRREVEALLRHDARDADPLAGALAGLLETRSLPPDPGEPEELSEGQRLGPYRLLGILGRGGLGTVYMAERADGQFERRVAVKVVRRELVSARLLADLRRERQILARFEHPNIARLYDGGEDTQGRPFLAMELVNGRPIDRYCDEQALPFEPRLRLFCDVCAAVAHAHRNLVIHRDLKPGNILVTAEGVLKLLDFGIALPVAPGDSRERAPQAFTPDYASPEQAAGRALTTATDVYSLGALMYRLLGGRAPFDLGGDLAPPGIEATLSRGPKVPPSEAARRSGAESWKELRPDLDAIVARAMAPLPEDRYASVEQLVEDIRRYLEALPVSAVGNAWSYRATKFLRRHRLAVGAAAIGLSALSGALLTTSWALHQARRARVVAEAHLDELESEQHRSSAMIETFVDTFRLADPGEARGETISVRELVDRSVAVLPEGAGSTDPELGTRLIATFGEIYLNLGSPDQAAVLFDRALERSVSTTAAEDLFHWRTRALLGEARIDQGQAADAAEALRQAIREHREWSGHRGSGLALLVHTLGVAHLQRAEADQAAALFRQAIRLFEDDAAADGSSALAMESRHRLAQALLESGELASAEQLLRQVIDSRRADLGEDHPSTVIALGDLAAAAFYRGENQRAADLFARVLASHRAVFGEEHPNVAVALQNLALAQRRLGQNDRARQNLLEVVALRQKLHDESHPAVAAAFYGLARFEHQNRRYDAAEAPYRKAFDLRSEHLGEQHPQTAMALLGLADLAWSRDRTGEAEPLYRQVLAKLEAAGQGESLDASFPSHQLGALLLVRGENDAACSWLRKAQTIRQRLLGPEHPSSRATEELSSVCQIDSSTPQPSPGGGGHE